MDASVIRIKDSKDFQVMSNVGDTSFGLHDIDERIVEHIINNKSAREKKTGKKLSDAHSVETVNAYASLVKNIKENIVENGGVSVDLSNMGGDETRRRNKDAELYMDKGLIANELCKDIYDWSLAHIDKAITQADVDDRDIDEIILIGEPSKMPGFNEYVKRAFPDKRISFVREDDLAVGAAIVVSTCALPPSLHLPFRSSFINACCILGPQAQVPANKGYRDPVPLDRHRPVHGRHHLPALPQLVAAVRRRLRLLDAHRRPGLHGARHI